MQTTDLYASKEETKRSNSDQNLSQATEQDPFNITGRITDENGNPFLGVTIIIKGTTLGTTSDTDGKYIIEVPDANSVLAYSFVGYLVEEIAVGNRSVIDISMNPDVIALGEVVVTALGIQKDSKKLGYSVSTIETDDLVTNRTTNPMESLVGRVAGLNITPPAAGAGSSMQIRLRGQAAFAGANNAPLIIINGLPMDQDARGVNGNGQVAQRDRGDNLQNIILFFIESMSLLMV